MDKAKTKQPYTRTVPICLRGDLVAEFEELERKLAEVLAKASASTSMEGGLEHVEIVERIEALREEMKSATHVFVLRQLPGKDYRKLKLSHPPRLGDDNEVIDQDRVMDANVDSLAEPLLRACCADPVIDDEVWAEIEELSDRQYDDLVNVAFLVNRGRVDVPFSRAASALLQSSEPA